MSYYWLQIQLQRKPWTKLCSRIFIDSEYLTWGSPFFLWLSGKLNNAGGWNRLDRLYEQSFSFYSIYEESRRSVEGGRVLRWRYKSCRKNTENAEKCTNALVLYTCVLDDNPPLVPFWVSTLALCWLFVCCGGGHVACLFICFILGNKTFRLHVKLHLRLWWL